MINYWKIFSSIFIVIILTVVIFFIASKILSQMGFDQKKGKVKSNPSIPLIMGSIFNLLITIGVFLIYKYISGRSISSMGFSLNGSDIIFCTIIFIGNFGLAWIFIRKQEEVLINNNRNQSNLSILSSYLILLFTLFAAAFQEEVVYRGVIVTLLIPLGWVGALVISTVLFTLVHYITSKITLYNTINWGIGGLMLFGVYYISGSIWVAAIVHTSRNLVNSFLFLNIPELSVVNLKTPLPEKKKSFYYALLSISTILFTFIWYFLQP